MAFMSANEPSSLAPSLSSAGSVRVHLGWARQLSVPVEALTSPEPRFFARETATAVVVVGMSESCVVVGPPAVIAQLDGLDKSVLLDASSLASRLGPFQPRPIGTASLSYRDARPVERTAVPTEPADPAMVENLRGSVLADEWDESGLSAMARVWAALTSDSRLAALAGYESWGADIAQMGVAADPAERGRGYAAAAAGEAMGAALNDGLVAQWRCRVGNTASERLAVCLGFTRLGQQTAVALGQ